MSEFSLEKRIMDAIVARFFEPQWIVSPGMVTDPSTGAVRTEPVLSQIPSEMSMVARAIYDQAKPEIIRKVLDQLDVDAIVSEWSSQIAKDVVDQLQANSQNNWSSNPTKTARQKMLDKVYEDVAAEFGRQAVEHIKKTGGLMAVLEAST